MLRGDVKMSRDGFLGESVSLVEEEMIRIQDDIDKLSEEKERIRQKRILLGKKQELLEEKFILEEENEDLVKGVRPRRQLIDTVGLSNIVLLIIMILLSGALLAESRGEGIVGRFAIIPLIAAAVLIWKMVDKAGGK